MRTLYSSLGKCNSGGVEIRSKNSYGTPVVVVFCAHTGERPTMETFPTADLQIKIHKSILLPINLSKIHFIIYNKIIYNKMPLSGIPTSSRHPKLLSMP